MERWRKHAVREFGKVEGTCSEGIWEGGGNMQ